MILYYFTRRATRSLRHKSQTVVNWAGLEDAIRVYRGPVTIVPRGMEKIAEWYSGNGHRCRRRNAFTLLDDSHTPPRLIHNGFPVEKIAFLNRTSGGTPKYVIDARGDIYSVEWYPAPHNVKVMEGCGMTP
jgi:hypothetical protein